METEQKAIIDILNENPDGLTQSQIKNELIQILFLFITIQALVKPLPKVQELLCNGQVKLFQVQVLEL